jgi:hypothetical protein
MANPRWKLRRLFQFSLLSAIVFLTVAGLMLGILARRVERQRTAVAEILKVGGTVSYEDSVASGSSIHREKAITPMWLRKQLGEDWFSSVHAVQLHGAGCNDLTLQQVKKLPSVRRIALWAWSTPPPEDNPTGPRSAKKGPLAGISDEGLKILRSMPNLEHVSFLGNGISDSGLKHLHNHPKLRSIQLGPGPSDSHCTKEGIAELLKSLGPDAVNQ